MSEPAREVTQLLQRLGDDGDQEAALRLLMPIVHGELGRLAAGYLGRERRDHTLQPTALVNEAFLRLAGQRASFESRAHFMAVAATAMRRILVNHARDRGRDKRGGGAERVELLDVEQTAVHAPAPDLVALDEALERFAAVDPRKVKVVEMRFFVGMSVEETAAALGLSPKTVKRDWQVARAWLQRELEGRAS